ncbi:MAG: family 78 glycoside hydrolase catalytic domain, partial [Anaerolineae bacterium]
GLLAQLQLFDTVIPTDENWLCKPCDAYMHEAPRISVMQAFEEHCDARLDDDWKAIDYVDSHWKPASEIRPAADGFHNNLEPRSIPFLTQEPVLPQRVVAVETVRSVPFRFTLNPKPHLVPGDVTCHLVYRHAYLATRIWSAGRVTIGITDPHERALGIKVNGRLPVDGEAGLCPGWNSLVVKTGTGDGLLEQVVCVKGPSDLVFDCKGDGSSAPWALVGPFALSESDRAQADQNPLDVCRIVVSPVVSAATHDRGERFWECGDVATVMNEPFFAELKPQHVMTNSNVFAQAYTDQVVAANADTEGIDSLLSNSGWATIYPSLDGNDVRILLDFGDELLAFHEFEVIAPQGTVIDFHNFEFIQPDGRLNFAEGMNNSFRYTCREGRQIYRTIIHRGFRYSYLILRNMTGPVKLHGVRAIFNSYPQARRGSFTCSDAKLDRIWQVGAQTLRCCSEDTYTDCPTYEQVLWVGDGRNEALVDWVINGDPRLWYRFLELTGQSLESSPLTLSQIPSSWRNVIPAWCFLWMRSCMEYLLFTGDVERGHRLLEFVERNVEGVEKHLDSRGLFDICAWNMFDWAPMDTPSAGVVTHQNCLAVLALKEAAQMARFLKSDGLASKWTSMADALSDAINIHLWNPDVCAYTDCLRDGRQSPVFSQQTQTVAWISAVAEGERAMRCLDILHNPPEGFVTAGSPFFEFFLLEALQDEDRVQEFLDTIRKDWGFMIDMGATTFWEMWSGRKGRLTRSHCHGWSAAPTYFLSTYVLGVQPVQPGFSVAMVAPHPADLTWCRGTVPTPLGDIEVQWENRSGEPFKLSVRASEEIEVRVWLPRPGAVTVNGKTVSCESDTGEGEARPEHPDIAFPGIEKGR